MNSAEETARRDALTSVDKLLWKLDTLDRWNDGLERFQALFKTVKWEIHTLLERLEADSLIPIKWTRWQFTRLYFLDDAHMGNAPEYEKADDLYHGVDVWREYLRGRDLAILGF